MGKNKKNKNENNIEVIDAMANEIKETADQNIESGSKQDEDQHPEERQCSRCKRKNRKKAQRKTPAADASALAF